MVPKEECGTFPWPLFSVQEHRKERIRTEIKMEKNPKITERARRNFCMRKELRTICIQYTKQWRILLPFILFAT